MKLYAPLFALVLAVPFTFIACGGDSSADVEDSCNDVVKEANSCNREVGDFSSGNCSTVAGQIKDTGCEGEAGDYFDCVKDNVCKDAQDVDDDACEKESDALVKCGDDFCADHTSDSRCTPSTQANGSAKLFSIARGNRS